MTDTVERPDGIELDAILAKGYPGRDAALYALYLEKIRDQYAKEYKACYAKVAALESRLTPSEDVKGLVDAFEKAKECAEYDNDVRDSVMQERYDVEIATRQAILDAFSARDAEIAKLKERVLTVEEARHVAVGAFIWNIQDDDCATCESIRSKLTPTTTEDKDNG